MKRLVSFLSLFTSASTLLCCALPALFVALGFGAAFAGLVGNVPQLIWISEHKISLFLIGAILLVVGGILQIKARELSCPVESGLGEACTTTKDWSRPIYLFSVAIYLLGAFFAFMAPRFL